MKYFPILKILYINREHRFSSSTQANLVSTPLSKGINILKIILYTLAYNWGISRRIPHNRMRLIEYHCYLL